MLPGVVQIQAAVCQLRRIYMDPRPTDCIEGEVWLMNPSLLLAFAVIVSICLVQCMSLLMLTPKYLAESQCFR